MRNRNSADNIILVILTIAVLTVIFFCIKSYEKPVKGYTLVNYKSQTY